MWLCPLLLSESQVRRLTESWDVDFGCVVVWGEGLLSFCIGRSGLFVGRAFSFSSLGLSFRLIGFPLFFSLLFLVCGVLGVLDNGVRLIVCVSFSFPICCISRLNIPCSVRFRYDGPPHCRKVEKRFRTYDCMQMHICNQGIAHTCTLMCLSLLHEWNVQFASSSCLVFAIKSSQPH